GQEQDPQHEKAEPRRPLDPDLGHEAGDGLAGHDGDGARGHERGGRAREDEQPRLPARGQAQRRELGLVAELGQEDEQERRAEDLPVHVVYSREGGAGRRTSTILRRWLANTMISMASTGSTMAAVRVLCGFL